MPVGTKFYRVKAQPWNRETAIHGSRNVLTESQPSEQSNPETEKKLSCQAKEGKSSSQAEEGNQPKSFEEHVSEGAEESGH